MWNLLRRCRMGWTLELCQPGSRKWKTTQRKSLSFQPPLAETCVPLSLCTSPLSPVCGPAASAHSRVEDNGLTTDAPGSHPFPLCSGGC